MLTVARGEGERYRYNKINRAGVMRAVDDSVYGDDSTSFTE